MFSLTTACVQMSVMMIVLLITRALLFKRTPPLILVVCWWLVFMRGLVPFFPLGHSTLLDVSDSSEQMEISTVLPGDGSGFLPADNSLRATGSACGLLQIVPMIAIAGSAACCVFFIAAYVKCRLRCRGAAPVHPYGVLKPFQGKRLSFGRRLRVLEASGIKTPFAYGVLRPTVVLPRGFVEITGDRQLRLILLHEISHIRRFDTLTKPLAVFVACLYWFNPLIWVALRVFGTDMERASDLWALRDCGRKERAMYARTLLKVKMPSNGLTNGFGTPSIESRIKAIIAPRPKTVACFLACLMALSCCFGSFAFASAAFPPEATQRVTVKNGTYSFDIPTYWQGRVSVRTDGSATYVYPTGYPELMLVSFSMSEDVDDDDVTGACPIVCEIPCSDGRVLVVRVMNYLDMAAGDMWSTAFAANPAYPGADGEELAVELSTFGQYSVVEAHAMDGVYAVESGHPQVVNLVAEPLLSTIEVE